MKRGLIRTMVGLLAVFSLFAWGCSKEKPIDPIELIEPNGVYTGMLRMIIEEQAKYVYSSYRVKVKVKSEGDNMTLTCFFTDNADKEGMTLVYKKQVNAKKGAGYTLVRGSDPEGNTYLNYIRFAIEGEQERFSAVATKTSLKYIVLKENDYKFFFEGDLAE